MSDQELFEQLGKHIEGKITLDMERIKKELSREDYFNYVGGVCTGLLRLQIYVIMFLDRQFQGPQSLAEDILDVFQKSISLDALSVSDPDGRDLIRGQEYVARQLRRTIDLLRNSEEPSEDHPPETS